MKKMCLTLSVVLLALLIWVKPVNGACFFGNIEAEKQTIAPGGSIKITIKISNLDYGTKGIDSFMTVLNYDKNIFENITNEDIKCLNSWDTPAFNETSGKIVSETTGVVQQDQDVFEITLKLKEDCTLSKTSISLTNTKVSNGTDLITSPDCELVLAISNLTSNDDNIQIDDENNIKIPDNTTKEDLENGLDSGKDIIIKDKDGNVLGDNDNVGTGSVVEIGNKDDEDYEEYVIIVLGDINGDGKISPIDLAKLNRHVLGIETITNEYMLKAADINIDGKVSPIDLAKLNRHVLGVELIQK